MYINTGLTNLDGIYILASYFENKDIESILTNTTGQYLNIALIILSIGYLFKVASAPFHFWSPDVYDAIPTIVTTFVAIVAKISIFIFLLELVHYTSQFIFEFSWINILLISSFLSLIIGTVGGLVQPRIKRLLAYSTISHVGFILLALTINSIESIQAFIFYLMQYSISNINIFFILIIIGYSLIYYNKISTYNKLVDKYNSPIQLISQLQGYYNINPILSLSLAISIFSLAGIPPLIGFFAKQWVLLAALQGGYYFIVLIAVLASVVSAVYYLHIVKTIFFDESEYVRKEGLENVYLSSSLSLTISVLTIIILLFILSPKEWLSIASVLALTLTI